MKRKHYDLYQTDEVRLQHVPRTLCLDDWRYLVKYFGTPEFQVTLHS